MALPKGTQFAMVANGKNLIMGEIPGIVQAQIFDAGFGGLHCPMEPEEDGGVWRCRKLPEVVELARQADGRNFHLFLWLYGNVSPWATAPRDLLSSGALAYEDEVANALAPSTNWTMGLQFDAAEDRLHEQIESWTHRMRTGPAGAHHYGCRARLSDAPYAGQFISVEQHITNRTASGARAVIAELMGVDQASPKTRVSGDRFRKRDGPDPDGKNFETFEEIEIVLAEFAWHSGRPCAFWGHGPNVSSMGSQPWPNAARLKEIMQGGAPPPGNKYREALEEIDVILKRVL